MKYNDGTASLPPILMLLVLLFGACQDTRIDEERTPADYVNPFIGASTSVGAADVYHGLGKTFPGATTPYGMVQVSPNTITGGDNGSGYSDEHRTIEGFAFTQMSGVGWYGDLGNFLVMPTTGTLQTIAGQEDGGMSGYRSSYRKDTEQARAGYYSVELEEYDIRVETTAAPHSGMMRFTFPEHEQSRIQIDLARRVGGTSVRQYIRKVDDYTIHGLGSENAPPKVVDGGTVRVSLITLFIFMHTLIKRWKRWDIGPQRFLKIGPASAMR